MPNQTQDQVNAGEFTFQQVRERVLYLGNKLETVDPGALTYDQVRDWAKDTAPQIQPLTTRISTLENTLEPILAQADARLKTLTKGTDDLQSTIKQEVAALRTQTAQEFQDVKTQVTDQLTQLRMGAQAQQDQSNLLTQQAKDEFDKHTVQHDSLIQHAKDKFDDIELKQNKLILDAQDKFREVENMFGQLKSVSDLLQGMSDSDVSAVRTKLAEKGLYEHGGGGRKTREISEYKAVGYLEKCAGDNKALYKAWTRKFRNAVEQARGLEWSEALKKIETHHVTDDFEELTTVDEKWDDWFKLNFGSGRTDGKAAIPIDEFKSDVNWVLTDKLGPHLVEIIQKYEKNGMRAYKKLYTWATDVSNVAKQVDMGHIMNPVRCTKDEELADRIELWDKDHRELVLIDSRCELKDPWRLVAFKCLLTEKMLDFVENQMDPAINDNYDEVRKRVYRWALKKRQAAPDHKGSRPVHPLEIPDQLPGGHSEQEYGHQHPKQDPHYENWGGGYPDYYGYGQTEWGPYATHALGPGKGQYKGKGKGKGPKGGCFTCGGQHFARDCPHGPKGGGKGGKAGMKGKGKGKGKFGKAGWQGKGKGKGAGKMSALSPAEQAQAQPQPGTGGDESKAEPTPKQVQFSLEGNNSQKEFQGYCFSCGEWGHAAAQCPYASNVQPGAVSALTANEHMWLGSLDPEVSEDISLKKVFEEAGWKVRGKKRFDTVNELLMFQRNKSTGHTPKSCLTVHKNKGPVLPEAPKGFQWKPIEMTIDSGACDHVTPKSQVSGCKVKMTEAVMHGVTYSAANGGIIPNEGEVDVQGYTADGKPLGLTLQVADVSKTLAAVRKMCTVGNRVVFDDDPADESYGGYIQNKKTGSKIVIYKQGGTYGITLWILVPLEAAVATQNKFESLSGTEEEVMFECPVFLGHA